MGSSTNQFQFRLVDAPRAPVRSTTATTRHAGAARRSPPRRIVPLPLPPRAVIVDVPRRYARMSPLQGRSSQPRPFRARRLPFFSTRSKGERSGRGRSLLSNRGSRRSLDARARSVSRRQPRLKPFRSRRIDPPSRDGMRPRAEGCAPPPRRLTSSSYHSMAWRASPTKNQPEPACQKQHGTPKHETPERENPRFLSHQSYHQSVISFRTKRTDERR